MVLVASVACRRDDAPARTGPDFRGVVLQTPIEKPDFTLTDFNGAPYNFRLQTADKVALLFFGYTHCPDVCPLHAANVAAVLKQLPFETRDAIRFVFVTTDPDRDTPERLKSWLGAFDSSFIGLRGTQEEVNRIQAGLRLAPARKEYPGQDSSAYLVGHAAQVIAFSPDGFARVEYPFGVRQEDWANDLPKLARGETPAVQRVSDTTPAMWQPGAPADSAPLPPLQIEVAIMPAPPSTSEAGVFLVIRNNAEADTLVEVSSPLARSAAIHRTTTSGGMQHMEHVGSLPIPAGGVTVLKPGDMHVMLLQLSRQPAAGESVPLRLRFARGNEMVLSVTVIPYADVERALAGQR
jgi:protein SCO1/2